MEKLSGIFDNREAMQRELWVDGELTGQWPAGMCDSGIHSVMPWERKALEARWGFYPNLPTRDN